jgi:ribosomal protein L44E
MTPQEELQIIQSKKRRGKELNSKERKILARYWASGQGSPVKKKKKKKVVKALVCMFCGKLLEQTGATFTRNGKQAACYTHVLLIRPKLDRQGNYNGHNIKFPHTAG